mgnify:CR=1 FL=1
MHTFKELFFFWVVVKLTDLDLKALKQCAMRCTVVDNVVNRGIFRILILSNLHLNSILEWLKWMKKTNFDQNQSLKKANFVKDEVFKRQVSNKTRL